MKRRSLKREACVLFFCGLILCLALLLNRRRSIAPPPIKKHYKEVILVGLPRSGSQTIHSFFQCQGWESMHACCDANEPGRTSSLPCAKTCGECVHANLLQGKPAFEGCVHTSGKGEKNAAYANFDVETSSPYAYFLPQHYALPLLRRDYPDALWVLNVRDTPERWAKNVLHWHSATERFLNSFPGGPSVPSSRLAPKPAGLKEKETRRALEESIRRAYDPKLHQEKRTWLEHAYQNHIKQVTVKAQSYQQDVLLVNVDDPGAGDLLVSALNLRTSTKCWNWSPDLLDNDWKNLSLSF